mgnify:CR=1 FL=1
MTSPEITLHPAVPCYICGKEVEDADDRRLWKCEDKKCSECYCLCIGCLKPCCSECGPYGGDCGDEQTCKHCLAKEEESQLGYRYTRD